MTDEERKEHLEWCRSFIDHHLLLRLNTPLLLSKNGGLHSWQFYMQIGTLHQEFSHRLGLLFWDYFLPKYEKEPFQLCALESGGVPLAVALQSVAYSLGHKINTITIKKEAKRYGLKNWFEGVVLEDLPVLMVDDAVASKKTLFSCGKRVISEGLTLYSECFGTLICRRDWGMPLEFEEKSVEVKVFYRLNDFAMTQRQYKVRYGKLPLFNGTFV